MIPHVFTSVSLVSRSTTYSNPQRPYLKTNRADDVNDEEGDWEGVVNVPDSLLGLLPRRGHLTTSSLLWIVLLGKPSCTIVRKFWENLQIGLTPPPP